MMNFLSSILFVYFITEFVASFRVLPTSLARNSGRLSMVKGVEDEVS